MIIIDVIFAWQMQRLHFPQLLFAAILNISYANLSTCLNIARVLMQWSRFLKDQTNIQNFEVFALICKEVGWRPSWICKLAIFQTVLRKLYECGKGQI